MRFSSKSRAPSLLAALAVVGAFCGLLGRIDEAQAQTITRLTVTARDENWSSWSFETQAGGTMVERVAVFSSGEQICENGQWFCGPQNLWQMRFEGNQVLSLEMVVRNAYHPRVSPDGRWVACMRHNGSDWDIWVYPLGNWSERVLFQSLEGYQERFPNWSNDSQWLAFDSDRPSDAGTDGYQVFVARLDDRFDPGAARQVTFLGSNNKHPTWNLDGTSIAYVGDAHDRRSISSVRLEDGAYRLITPEAGQNRHPDWSPDGRWIAFVTERWDGIGDIAIVDAIGGGDVVRISVGMDGHDDFPEWSRDSHRILFCGTYAAPPYRPNKEIFVAEDLPFEAAAVEVSNPSLGGLKRVYRPVER